jgi:hypothetical protein
LNLRPLAPRRARLDRRIRAFGDRHYIRDGHHRVSIAHALKADAIDADVVELIELPPSVEAAR